MQTVITNAIVSLGVAALTALITIRLSLRRFHSERWWEKKLESYLDIIDALHHSKRYIGRLLLEIEEGTPLSDEIKKKLADKYMDASARLEKASDIGFFIVSHSAWAVLDSFRRRPSSPPDPEWYRYFSEEYDSICDALEKIKTIAREDLKR